MTETSASNFADVSFLKKLFKQCVKKNDFKHLERWFKETFPSDPDNFVDLFSSTLSTNCEKNQSQNLDLGKIYITSEVLVKTRNNESIQTSVNDKVESMFSILEKNKSHKSDIIEKSDEKLAIFSFAILHLPIFFTSPTQNLLNKLLKMMHDSSRQSQQKLRELIKSVKTQDSIRLIVPQLKVFLEKNSIEEHKTQNSTDPEKTETSESITHSTKISAEIACSLEMTCWMLQLVHTSSSSVIQQFPEIEHKLFICDFINDGLLINHYNAWISRNRSVDREFSFCDFTFLISSLEKRKLLTKIAECEMVSIAENYFKGEVKKAHKKTRHQNKEIKIDVGQIFFEVKVRRDNLVADSLRAIKENRENLRRKLKIEFENEKGIDLGGLTKEWFMLLIKELTVCDDSKGQKSVFTTDENRMFYWLNGANKNLEKCYLFGCLMGLAIHNSTIIDINLPLFYFKKLLSPAVYKTNSVSMVKSEVGSIEVELDHLSDFQPDVMRSLQNLLEYSGNVEDDFALDFTASVSENGSVNTFNLKSNGSKIPVTNDNRQEYVNRYLEFNLNKYAQSQFEAFYKGFHQVCDSQVLLLLTSRDLQRIICGDSTDLDFEKLRKVCSYEGGFKANDLTVENLWTVVKKFDQNEQKLFLSFLTGSKRLPIGGFSEMKFTLKRVDALSDQSLPIAHTCFNELQLPVYKDLETLREKLTYAINNCRGYELE
ncbi:putative E3 ubiquitin-protein ligase HECTD2 isoform X1 [Convolutriloba macropyga]|uniref:putative E3 ubiquitin-protein ligase HECTD2 isoform X1 n=1 Tax=Convolutriloba macropyga TaxID=536237 RepID=UPI003F521813